MENNGVDTFFGPSWIGKQVDFEQSTWKITVKERERVELLTWSDIHGLRGGPKVSYVRARFFCQDVHGVQAFLSIYMQIPHAGTRLEPAGVRGSQATKRDHDEVIAYRHFGDKVQYMPKSLGYKLEVQPQDSMLVPGGYVEYIVWEKLPGIRLHPWKFWALDEAERQDIIDAFKPAYKELFQLGIEPVFFGTEHMLWDKENKTIYIIGFNRTGGMTDEDALGEKVLENWDLLSPPSVVVDFPRPVEHQELLSSNATAPERTSSN